LKSEHLYYPSIQKLLYFKLHGDLDMQGNLSSKPKIINPKPSIKYIILYHIQGISF